MVGAGVVVSGGDVTGVVAGDVTAVVVVEGTVVVLSSPEVVPQATRTRASVETIRPRIHPTLPVPETRPTTGQPDRPKPLGPALR